MRARCPLVLLATGCLSAPPSAPQIGEDGGSEPADGGPDRCGTLRSLSESFDSIDDWQWSVDGVGPPMNGQISLSPPAGDGAAIFSNRMFRLEDSEIVIHLDLSGMATESEFAAFLENETNSVTLQKTDNGLEAYVEDPESQGTRASVEWDADMMTWWRLGRGPDGMFHWATSSDGTNWTEHPAFSAGLDGLVGLGMVHYAEIDLSEVLIDGINPDAAVEPNCAATSFTDDFAGRKLHWGTVGVDACDVAYTGQLEIALTAPDVCGVESVERFSFAGGQVSVELLEANDCEINPTLELGFAGGTLSFTCSSGATPMLRALHDGEELGIADFDPEAHRRLRIRHAPDRGGIVFETAPADGAFTQMGLASDIADLELESTLVMLLVNSPAPPEQAIAFDQLNL